MARLGEALKPAALALALGITVGSIIGHESSNKSPEDVRLSTILARIAFIDRMTTRTPKDYALIAQFRPLRETLVSQHQQAKRDLDQAFPIRPWLELSTVLGFGFFALFFHKCYSDANKDKHPNESWNQLQPALKA